MQIQNIVKAVVPRQDLLDAQMQLAVADQVGELVGSHVIVNPAEGVAEALLS